MSKPFHVVIIGGGPGGLATALSLAQHPSCSTSPVRITVLELRDTVQTIGGAINLTPLALRYLDSLGAGKRLRPRGSPVSAIELVAHRTGHLLGQLWPGVDALRVQRQYLVESLLAALREETDSKLVTIEYGARVVDIEEYGDADNGAGGVRVVWSKDGNDGDRHVIDANLVVGADGIHSQVRSFFDANREKTYSGKCVAYGFIRTTPEEAAQWKRADGQPLVTDTTLVQHGSQSLLVTYYQAQGERDGLYLAAVMPVEDASPANGSNGAASSREGWSVRSADKAGLKRDIAAMFSGGSLPCLEEIIGRCEDWFFYPVYMLPPDGTWSSGRLQLIGDAAHAMPPQGESTGVAMEDGVLLAHVLSRRDSRSVEQMLGDYDKLRRSDVNSLYKSSMARWRGSSSAKPGWLGSVFMEWMSWAVVTYLSYTSGHFGRDVRDLPLPE